MQSDVDRCELYRGELIRMSPVSLEHGEIVMRLGMYLGIYLLENPIGSVSGDVGFKLERHPDTVFAPDVAIVLAAVAAEARKNRGYPTIAPQIAFEVVSPDDTASELNEKVSVYLERGVQAVVVVWPKTRQVSVWDADGTMASLGEHDAFELPNQLPGFSLPISKLFA